MVDETKLRILVVEDDEGMIDILCYNLSQDGYECLKATDGASAVEMALHENPALVLLDIMLPKLDGFEVCRILRKKMSVPIIILTAKIDEIDKIIGLELGADDYITKPFSMRELRARVKSVLRRSRMSRPGVPEVPVAEEEVLASEDLVISPARHQAMLDGVVMDLTPKEFALLEFMMRNRGLVLSREQILEKVWGYDYTGDTQTVDFHILRLRKKIEISAQSPQRLLTVWGVGYRLAF